jgi:hypothetical protein
LNQSALIPIGSSILIRFYDARDSVVFIFFLTKPAGNVTIEATIADHLLPVVRDMGGYGRQPFKSVKSFFFPVVLGSGDDTGLFWEIGRS